MTEKRFEVYDDGFSKHIEDTYYTEDRHENNLYDIWDMCRKLNELHEENTRLKEQLKCEKQLFTKKQLHEENQRLKKQLQTEHQQLENAILLERTRMGKNSLKQYKETIQ